MARRKGRSVADVSRYTAPSGPSSSFGQDDFDERPMSGITFFLVVVVLFVALAFASVFFGTRSIESTIAANSARALSAEFPEVSVEVEGTAVTISGRYTDQDPQRAFDLVESVNGVTSVDGNIWPRSTEELGDFIADAAPLRATWSAGSIVVTGELSSEERIDTVDRTLTALTSETDTSPALLSSVDISGVRLNEEIAEETTWLGPALSLLVAMLAETPEGSFVADSANGLLQISGTVEQESVKDALNQKGEETRAAIGFSDFTPGILVPKTGPTEEEIEEVQEELNEVILDQVVEFEVKSFELTEAGRELLDRVVETLAAAPEVLVLIEGHTDDRGTDEENMILSEERANAVRTYLVSQGLDPERFETIGYGESRPIDTNDTEEGRARNRRIQFTAQYDNVQEGDG